MSGIIRVELVLASGERVGRTYTLRPGQAFQIGRSPKTAIHLDDALVSRVHALVELRKEGLFVTDLGSRNGTFLDGETVAPHSCVDASNAKELTIGDHRIMIRMQGDEDDSVETIIDMFPSLPEEEYEILGVLGEGSMGRVYSAEQKLLSRKVAIKVLHPDHARDEEAKKRFLRQGWLCSEVRSPHIVDIYDVRTYRHQVCLIMELVQGPSAADLLGDGPLPIPEVLRIGEHISRALQALQEAGVVHRAVKPANILLDPSGVVKLSDFGDAKAVISEVQEASTPLDGYIGTPAYAAPELLEEAQATMAGDVYALGATLHHLARGGRSTGRFKKTERVPSLRSAGLVPEPPGELDDLLQAMTDPDPKLRPAPATLPDLFRSIRLKYYSGESGTARKGMSLETDVGSIPEPDPEED